MTFWTEDRVTELRGDFAAELTAGQIAARMGGGITRNAVLGKLHRMGLKRDDNRAVRILRMRQGIAAAPRKPRKPRPSRASQAPAIDSPPTQPAPTRPAGPPIGFEDLRNWTCRWPIGEGPYLFCGRHEADAGKGIPYCIEHARMAYRRPGEREEAA